jgi:hypothetical protein
MSISVEIDPTRPYGGMTKLPEGTHGHFPERIPLVEQFEREDGFTPPRVLTKSQLIEQIGQDLYDKDVLWFLWDIRRFPCVSKFATITTLSTFLASSCTYFLRPKFTIQQVLRVGVPFGAIAGLGSLSHCIWDHVQWWKEVQSLKNDHRDKLSYSFPEFIQRERDAERYAELHKDELLAVQLEEDRIKKERQEMMLHMRRGDLENNVIAKFKKDGV